MNTKTCSKCGISKSMDLFPTNKNKCKDCVADYMKEYYQKRKDELSERHKKWVETNPKKHLEHQRRYRQKNPQIYSEAARKWRKKNPGKVKALKKTWEKSTCSEIKNYYCKKILARQLGVSRAVIPAGLVDLKRHRIILVRLTRQLTNLIKEKSHGS